MSSVKEGQEHLRKIANALKNSQPLLPEDRQFITEALLKIADGEDAQEALNIKAKRGERTKKESQNAMRISECRKRLALGWIATAIAPKVEGGLGLTLEEAIGRIGENDLRSFKLTEETLKTYWNKNSDLRERDFKLPD